MKIEKKINYFKYITNNYNINFPNLLLNKLITINNKYLL